MELTHYQTLGVAVGASAEQIRQAYGLAVQEFRARLRETPPPAASAFDALRLAYQTLSDPARRQHYDDTLRRAAAEAGVAAAVPPAVPRPPVAVPVAADDAAETRHPLQFTGDGTAYFRIWIVNLLLSVVTLGIYSAWAKVRREQFFHRNLQLDGAAFDYHGSPKAILKGRLLAVLALGTLSLTQEFNPLVYSILSFALIPVFPWVMVRALRFRAANTSYRGLRFSFDGGYREALSVFVGYGLLTLLTLGTCFPLWYRAQQRFVLSHLRFGRTRFDNAMALWPIYRTFIVPVMLTTIALVVVGAGAVSSLGGLDPKQAQLAQFGIVFALFGVLFVASLLLGPYIRVRLTNLVWNATTLGPHRFESGMHVRGYLAIAITNLILIVLTLGLFFPFARVRLARYRAEHTALLAHGSIEHFVAGERADPAAAGEELADLADVDFAL